MIIKCIVRKCLITLNLLNRWWLSDEGTAFLLSTKDDKMLPEMPRRLLCDAYICWYASDVLRYR